MVYNNDDDILRKRTIEMIIQESSITITYKRIEGLKKAYYTNDEILKEHFSEATVLPVPDDAPLEIPRIIVKTLNEHGQLNISPIAATFQVKYNDGYENDWQKCSSYLCERMDFVFRFLNLLTNDCYDYIGLVTNILYDEVTSDGAKKLSSVLLNSKGISDLYDINIRYTFLEDNDIFVNIMLQNARMFEQGLDGSKAGALSSDRQLFESIGAVIDINDRRAFNNKPGYTSSSLMMNKLINSMNNVINFKLRKLIEKGEY